MHALIIRCLLAGLLALALSAPAAAQPADNVVLYRCTGAGGALAIRSVPCLDSERQEVMSMVRPKDAPATAAPAAPAPAPVEQAPPAPAVVVVRDPRPLYECVRPDGSVYESDTGDGEPRWVPLWTLGYPSVGYGGYGGYGGHGGGRRHVNRGAPASAGLSAPATSGISVPPAHERPVQRPPPRAPGRPGHGHGYGGYDAGTWVRDECHALPQGEVCARLADRRDVLRTRFFNAQQRERDTLRVEERGLTARLAQDCGVR
jgi:hypothetical protein